MAQKKNSNSEKMVLVEGVWTPESKAEGRRAAKADQRRRHAAMEAALQKTRDEEVNELREAKWTDDEIRQYFLAREAEEAKAHGFIQPTPRIKRTSELPFGPGVMFH